MDDAGRTGISGPSLETLPTLLQRNFLTPCSRLSALSTGNCTILSD